MLFYSGAHHDLIQSFNSTQLTVNCRNGELKEYITSGVTKDEFLRRLAGVFQLAVPAATPSQAAPSPSGTSIPATRSVQEAEAAQPPPTARPSQTRSPVPASSSQQESRAVQDMPAERAARLEADKKEKEAAEKARRAAEAKARKAAIEEAPEGTQKSADMKYALMQKRRQQEARAERERILKRVEYDKAERRKREAQRKAQAKVKEDTEKGIETEAPSPIVQPPSRIKSAQCALQIRLFDGSTIRSRFPSDDSLRVNVRPWIDEQQPGDTPYTFKQVLTPLPNKNISISDEEQSLQSQGLTPSATLILVPVQGYTSAYEDGASSGIVSRVASGGYGLVSSGVGLVTGVLGSFLGGGGAAPPAQERPVDPAPANPNPAINVQTLRDRDRDDQQFYNGNAVSLNLLATTSRHWLTRVAQLRTSKG